MKIRKIVSLFLLACLGYCFCSCAPGGDGSSTSEKESVSVESESGSQSESQAETISASVRIMSINMAGQDMTDSENLASIKYPGQNGQDYSYQKRRERLDALIGEYTPDVLLLQEVNGSNWWWPYLVSNDDSFLNTFTNYNLVGRTNRVGGEEGAGKYWYDLYNQLYYDTGKFEEVASGMFYLNVRRTEPFSKTWHESGEYSSDDNNTCVWAVLKDRKTGLSAVYASTHLKPTGGYLARALTNYRQAIQVAEGLYEISEEYADEYGLLPISVGGDFNLITTHEYNYAYPHMTEVAHYADAQKIAEKTDKSGTARVWGANKNGADDGSTSDGSRIDLFFTQGMEVKKYQCLNGMFYEDAGGTYYSQEKNFDGSAYDLSDHLPIMMNVRISNTNRDILPPSDCFENGQYKADSVLNDGDSIISSNKIVMTGADLLEYFSSNQYMQADMVDDSVYGSVLRLMATESCPNVYACLDYGKLMADRGLEAAQIANISKIKINCRTAFTVSNTEFVVSLLNEGDPTVNYGANVTRIANGKTFAEKTMDVSKSSKASGKVTGVLFGTMCYSNDFSGVCGLYKGDCIYIRSIEFVS